MTITLSPKFQIVIPKVVREQLNLKAGAKFQVWANQGRIELVPDEPIENFEGRYKGLNLQFEREPDREV
jgi:AbrB family looped-hinge helix DNA binding protein